MRAPSSPGGGFRVRGVRHPHLQLILANDHEFDLQAQQILSIRSRMRFRNSKGIKVYTNIIRLVKAIGVRHIFTQEPCTECCLTRHE